MHSQVYVFFLQCQIGVGADLTYVGSCTLDPSIFLVSFYGASSAAPWAELKSVLATEGWIYCRGEAGWYKRVVQ